MIVLGNIQIDFDITSPMDVLRYKNAGERMEAESQKIPAPPANPDDPAFLEAYIDMLNNELRLYGNFLDEVFGDGIANQLLGGKPSLTKVTEVSDAIASALETQSKEFGVKLQKYRPNRATRRTK